MKQSKITQILEALEREGKYGKMFTIAMTLENWETIQINKKNKDAFKVWDNIKYEVIEEWKKRKEVKEENRGVQKQHGDQRGYFTSIAFQIAFNQYSWEESYQNCSNLARRIYSDMLDNYWG